MASSDTDEESGGIQAGTASPRSRARVSTPQTFQAQSSGEQDHPSGAFNDDDNDDDDGVGPASEGACGIWVGLLARLLLSVVSTLVSAALVVLYPLYLLTPRIVTETLFKGVFRIGCVSPRCGRGPIRAYCQWPCSRWRCVNKLTLCAPTRSFPHQLPGLPHAHRCAPRRPCVVQEAAFRDPCPGKAHDAGLLLQLARR